MRAMGKQGDSENANVILELAKQSISSSDDCCGTSFALCVQFWLPLFKTVLNDPRSIKMSSNCYRDHYLLVHMKKWRKLRLLGLLKQPEREQEQNCFEKQYLEKCSACFTPGGEEAAPRAQQHLSLVCFDSVLLLMTWRRKQDMLIKFTSDRNLREIAMLVMGEII